MSLNKYLFLSLFCTPFSFGETPDVDALHKSFSKYVLQWSKVADDKMCEYLNKYKSPDNFDDFFQNQKRMTQNNNTFMRIRMESYFESKGYVSLMPVLMAQFPFIKSQERIKIFIDNMNLENTQNLLEHKENNAAISINYFAPERYGIESKYSVGLAGLNPFTSATYRKAFQRGVWLIEPVQRFQYSVNNQFEEETNLYFDTHFKTQDLFRIQLFRKTQSTAKGVDYALSLQYYLTPQAKTGIYFSQSFIGNTAIEPFKLVSNFVSLVGWRENVWRKWFYYEIQPSVSFNQHYDYQPNYTLRLFFDFYFGEYN